MPLPLLEYTSTSRNTRVPGFEIPGDEQPRIYSNERLRSVSETGDLIEAAYLQIFHEQQMLSFCRQTYLESQLSIGNLTVRDFIRGLATSDTFRRLNYDVNNNYRFVELCVQRILGRQVYNEREKLAWSIVLATQGLNGFITELIDSDEYMMHFGEHTVPYQRRRVLPQQPAGEWTFAHTARYGSDYRDKLPLQGTVQASRSSGSGLSWNLDAEEKRLLIAGFSVVIVMFLWLIFHAPVPG